MNRFLRRRSRPRLLRATWLALLAACASAVLVVSESALAQAVPMDAAASPAGSLLQGDPVSSPAQLEASPTDVSEVALPATWAGTAPPLLPTTVADLLGHVARCVVEPPPARGESRAGPAEVIPRDCPLHVSMEALNPDMYQDLVDETCGESDTDFCIVVGVCKLTRQVVRTTDIFNNGSSTSETFCKYGGCMHWWEEISAVEAAFMSADDR